MLGWSLFLNAHFLSAVKNLLLLKLLLGKNVVQYSIVEYSSIVVVVKYSSRKACKKELCCFLILWYLLGHNPLECGDGR